MAKKRRKSQSAVKRDLRTPKYRMRVVEDKRQYDRKKHKRVSMESWPKAANDVAFGELSWAA